MTKRLTVEAWFDFICPWCLIGRRHLDAALAAFAREAPDVEVLVAWRPVLLLPQTPAEGTPFQAFYERRLGGRAAVAARQAQVREAARAAGVEIAFERIETFPNSFAAHALVDHVRRETGEAAAEALTERLFAAYFQEGEDIGDHRALIRLARSAGVDAQAWSFDRDAPASVGALAGWARGAERARVSGVPYYLFDGRLALSGAQPPAILIEAMRVATAADVTRAST